jgi:hypothetical protein
MVSSSDCEQDARQRAAKSAARLTDSRAITPKSMSTNGMRVAAEHASYDARQRRLDADLETRGTTSFREVGPEVVLICRVSGDVNQGREMKVLPRELDALDAAMVAIERVGKRGRPRHPEGVGRVFEPLVV